MNEEIKIMKSHISSNQIVAPAPRKLSGLTPGNRDLSRRGFLGAGMTLAAASVLTAEAGERRPSDPRPGNSRPDSQNPEFVWPPRTGSKSLVSAFKYPF